MVEFESGPDLLTNGSMVSLSVGLQVDTLAPLDRLTIHTANSRYDIVVICPSTGSVLLKGGQLSTRFVPGHIAGSSLNGEPLKPYAVVVGCPLALLCGNEGFLTSSVKAIECIHASGPH